MATSIFENKAEIPDDPHLAEALGSAKPLWDEIESHIVTHFSHAKKEWKYYSKKAGWSLVFKNKDKTLLYCIPCKEYFKVWFVLGKKAVNAAMQAPLPKDTTEAIAAAPAYAEGTGFFVDVKQKEDLDAVMTLLDIKAQG